MLKANGVKTVALSLRGRPVRPGEFRRAARWRCRAAASALVEDKSYPGRREGPVAGAALHEGQEPRRLHRASPIRRTPSWPAGRRKEIGFNPKFFYASVGTAFQLYRNVMTPAGAEGVLGHGFLERQDQPGRQGLLRRAHARSSAARSPTAGPAAPAGPALEILTSGGGQARPGPQGDPRLRRRARAQDHHRGRSTSTAARTSGTPGTVGQWQNGEFEVVWPQGTRATAPELIASKPRLWNVSVSLRRGTACSESAGFTPPADHAAASTRWSRSG